MLVLLVLGLSTAASGHTEAMPRRLTPGSNVRIVIVATPEREPFVNQALSVLVPRQFEPLTCDGPDGWTCSLDRQSFDPHVVIEWQPLEPPSDRDLEFGFTTIVPFADGAWLFRALQTHPDGYVEPWVYNDEPFPAAFVIVGDDDRIANPDGSAEDPPCYGPSRQPRSYEEHDGRAVESGCDPSQPAPEPEPAPSGSPGGHPSPGPTASASSDPTPSPTATASTNGASTASEPPSDDPTASGPPTDEPTDAATPDDASTTEPAQPGPPSASEPTEPPPAGPRISDVRDLDAPRDADSNGLGLPQLIGITAGLGLVGFGVWRRRR